MGKNKVVIVGGGFGGIKAALELAGDRRFQVTLISELTTFRYYPTLYRTATGGRKIISSIPLKEIFSGKNINLINDTVIAIDRDKRLVTTKVKHQVSYDALLLAIGVKTNYFNIEGLEEFSYGIKSVDDAERLKSHIHQQLIDDRRPDANYVVIGGGPTGIELAGELPAYVNKVIECHELPARKIHVDLVEAAPRLLPRMPKDISRHVKRRLRKLGVKIYLKTAVQAQNAEALMIHDKPIRSHTVIWTAGITNHPFFKEQGFQIARNGKVRVDQFLQAEPGIYVIGDNADTPYSGMAQTALYDGEFVADNLKKLAIKDEPVAYIAKKPIYVIPVGPRYAAVLWGKLRVFGIFGWILRRLADFKAYNDYLPWQLAAKLWIAEDDEESSCLTCARNQQ
ncbi:FAD-dependent oxidoreductase [Candidatus Saccharibacteria bacterium]|nr:FAD-dependent oxidoreductase [Candidatus Saccharibacteria bacterium]